MCCQCYYTIPVYISDSSWASVGKKYKQQQALFFSVLSLFTHTWTCQDFIPKYQGIFLVIDKLIKNKIKEIFVDPKLTGRIPYPQIFSSNVQSRYQVHSTYYIPIHFTLDPHSPSHNMKSPCMLVVEYCSTSIAQFSSGSVTFQCKQSQSSQKQKLPLVSS